MDDYDYEDDFSPEDESPNASLTQLSALKVNKNTGDGCGDVGRGILSSSPPGRLANTPPPPGRGSAGSSSVTLNEATAVVTSAGAELKTSSVSLKIPKGSLDKETFVHLFEIGNDLVKTLDAVSY